MAELYEKKLLHSIAEGDESAFAQLFYSYHQRLGAYIYQITCSREIAEEVVMDVFQKTWQHRYQLGEAGSFQGWLFMVAKNHAVSRLKQQIADFRKEKLLEKSTPEEPALQALEAEDNFHLLDKAIEQLPQEQRKIFIMSRYHRLKHEEIAAELNLSKETVRSYLEIATSSVSRFITDKSHLVVWMTSLLSVI